MTPDDPPVCADGLLQTPLPAINDAEGAAVPPDLPPIVDAHVHLFPDRLFEAIWAWFERHGWPIRYKLRTPEVIDFLLSRGVDHLVGLHYAHKPGMARALNSYMAGVVAQHAQVTGVATFHPDDDDLPGILNSAFDAGLKGVKLHCHVQCMAADDPRLFPAYETAAARGQPIVIHAGREPKSPAYKCDPHVLCQASRIENVLKAFPTLKLCVPHLGADEFAGYLDLIERYDTLWVDTTMALAGYLPGTADPWQFLEVRPERILYGTDFPNLPYAWDRELRRIAAFELSESARALVFGGTARALFDLP